MKVLTPIKAIRKKCLECSCGSFLEVKLCVIKDCALYPYRLGHRPKKELTEQTITSNDIDIQANTDHEEPT